MGGNKVSCARIVCFVLFCLISHFHSWFYHLPTLKCCLICTGTCICMASLLCLCLFFLLSALLTRVVCAQALLVSTSVSPPTCVHGMCVHEMSTRASYFSVDGSHVLCQTNCGAEPLLASSLGIEWSTILQQGQLHPPVPARRAPIQRCGWFEIG